MSEKQTVKFGDLCREVKLTTKDPIADGYERYIGLEHLDSGSLKIKRWGIIAEDSPSFTRVFKKGQILLGKRRSYLKKAAIAEFDGICSGDIIVIETNESSLSAKELAYLIQSNKFWSWAIKTSSGSLSPRTKFKVLADLVIKLPKGKSLEQFWGLASKKAELVNRYDTAIESCKQLRSSLRAQLLFKGIGDQKLIKTHWGECPVGWTYKPFTEIAEVNPSYKLNKVGTVKFCDMAAVETDSIFVKKGVEERESSTGGARFKNGDILFARITPCAENGKMAIVDFLNDDEIGKGSTEFIVVSPRKVTPFYLYSLCRTNRVRLYAIGHMEGTTGRQRIPASVFENIMIPVPPEHLMLKIEKTLLDVEKNIERLNDKKSSLTSLQISYIDSVLG